MEYGRGDSFPFGFEPNGIPFLLKMKLVQTFRRDTLASRDFRVEKNQMEFHLCSKSKGKLSPQSYPIQCERKWKYSVLSVAWGLN